MRKSACWLTCLLTVAATGNATADSGSFSLLTYNVAGLPELLSSAESDRQAATEEISCYVNQFDVVHVQEDFNYHAALYDTCNTHPYRSPTSGGVPFGSGLNTMSNFPYTDWSRVSWDSCTDTDCLTPKGFTLSRMRLAEGVYVDIYNLHAQAQVTDAALEARRDNVLQLLEYISLYSAGNAVIVAGDTNTRYTREGDNVREFLHRGFTDVWLGLSRSGSVPAAGAEALLCDPAYTGADCEIVDKVFFRDNGYLGLAATTYEVREDAYTDAGVALSDHPPVVAEWAYDTVSNRRLSDASGGDGGYSYNDVAVLPAEPAVQAVSLRSGSRVDRIELTLGRGYVLSHGGAGGSAQTLTMGTGEYLASMEVCTGIHNDRTRVFYLALHTNQGHSLSGGSSTSSCATYAAPSGYQIVGFHGRAGDELDKVGAVFAPYLGTSAGAAEYFQVVNQASGLCLDIWNAEMASGTNVAQWNCTGDDWQLWNYDATSGLIRSKSDPRFCLENGGGFDNGSSLRIWACHATANQQFTVQGDVISVRTAPWLVVDAAGTAAGDDVLTWGDWGGANQRWHWIP